MKKSPDAGKMGGEWAKHLRKYGKRVANKATRKAVKNRIKKS